MGGKRACLAEQQCGGGGFHRELELPNNSNYQCVESKTNACKRGNESYSWHGDNIYGASLLALSRVADENGYSLAWVESHLDAVFVKKSLLCPDSSVPYKEFCAATGTPVHTPASAADRQKWVVEYP